MTSSPTPNQFDGPLCREGARVAMRAAGITPGAPRHPGECDCEECEGPFPAPRMSVDMAAALHEDDRPEVADDRAGRRYDSRFDGNGWA